MSRETVRPAVAKILSSATDAAGGPLFAAVFDAMPPVIDERQTPACFVMLGKQKESRRGMQIKIVRYEAEARIWFKAPSEGWQSPAAGNLYVAPATDPQKVFDQLLDQLYIVLRANKSFQTDVAETGTTPIFLGEAPVGESAGIETVMAEPQQIEKSVVLAAIVRFPVAEQILGV